MREERNVVEAGEESEAWAVRMCCSVWLWASSPESLQPSCSSSFFSAQPGSCLRATTFPQLRLFFLSHAALSVLSSVEMQLLVTPHRERILYPPPSPKEQFLLLFLPLVYHLSWTALGLGQHICGYLVDILFVHSKAVDCPFSQELLCRRNTN